MRKMRLLLLDDHALFRESLARLLADEPDFEIAAHCSSIEEAIEALRKHAPDLVLLDFDLGQEKAPEFLKRAKDAGFSPRVLLVTAGMQPGDMAFLLEQGISGVFLKQSPPALLASVVRRILAGETWIDPECVKALAHAAAHPAAIQTRQSFTQRETQVLRGIFEGQSNKEIAGALGISESSVKAALQQLFSKAGVRTRSQLVRVALQKFSNEWSS